MSRTSEQAEALQAVELFACLSPRSLERVAKRLELVDDEPELTKALLLVMCERLRAAEAR